MATTTTVQWMLAKAAELELQAGALRTAAAILDGMVSETKRAKVNKAISQAVALRRAQTNGNGTHAEPEAPAPTRPRTRTPKLTQEALKRMRAIKRNQILAILRDYGKPMPIQALTEAARARGVDSLTGMISYVRAGYLSKSGHRGKTRYTFRQEPEQQE